MNRIFVLLIAVFALLAMSGCSKESDQPVYVQLRAFEYGGLPDGAKPVRSYLSEMRQVTFFFDVSEHPKPGVVGESNRLDYIVDKEYVDQLISINEKDKDTGERNTRLFRVSVSEPYMSPPRYNGVPVLSWNVIKVWASPGG